MAFIPFSIPFQKKIENLRIGIENRPQKTDPKYLKNAESEHLVSLSLPNLTNEIGLFFNPGI